MLCAVASFFTFLVTHIRRARTLNNADNVSPTLRTDLEQLGSTALAHLRIMTSDLSGSPTYGYSSSVWTFSYCGTLTPISPTTGMVTRSHVLVPLDTHMTP
ncbi:hypothetical protein NDU88_005595 [Pleurodeles waltl]|uniref:Secreted protein n=1 Tax=Pleurodeles waltl TaxID=8319 RepID=A0AAV7VP01_PLEWA|nr:hypothetical protein NDU88_005595 [Pleurodeles waltl]